MEKLVPLHFVTGRMKHFTLILQGPLYSKQDVLVAPPTYDTDTEK